MTHSFFVVMGGVCAKVQTESNEKSYRYAITPDGVRHLVQKHKWVPDIEISKVQDRSKASMFVKVLFILQGKSQLSKGDEYVPLILAALWFCTQCIGRLAQSLAVSLLELRTFAHAICALLCCAFWWKKPADVYTSQNFARKRDNSRDVNPLINDMGWEKPHERGYKEDNAYLVRRARNAPWCLFDYNLNNWAGASLIPVCAIYGGLHCLGWNAAFSSVIEQRLWQICAVSQVAAPLALLLNSVSKKISEAVGKKGKAAWITCLGGIWLNFYMWCCLVGIFLIRTYIFVECFLDLRHLPESAYRTVSFSQYIPHFG